MTPDIIIHDASLKSGHYVLVTLSISAEEHVLIYKHRMLLSLDIVPASDDRPALKFHDFYGGTHATMWPVNSVHQGHKLKMALLKGFADFNAFLDSNRRGEPKQLPWNFFDTEERFSHAWVVATTGSGKTTLLSALINEDLDKVKRGEASVIVIDSQNEHLGKYLPHLARFAEGGDLYGKLIYLAPDLRHPLALNIFDFTGYGKLDPNEQLEMLNTARDMLMFFIGATVDVPTE
jgi:hypothetical protein